MMFHICYLYFLDDCFLGTLIKYNLNIDFKVFHLLLLRFDDTRTVFYDFFCLHKLT